MATDQDADPIVKAGLVQTKAATPTGSLNATIAVDRKLPGTEDRRGIQAACQRPRQHAPVGASPQRIDRSWHALLRGMVSSATQCHEKPP